MQLVLAPKWGTYDAGSGTLLLFQLPAVALAGVGRSNLIGLDLQKRAYIFVPPSYAAIAATV
jgi:hypothetical protein